MIFNTEVLITVYFLIEMSFEHADRVRRQTVPIDEESIYSHLCYLRYCSESDDTKLKELEEMVIQRKLMKFVMTFSDLITTVKCDSFLQSCRENKYWQRFVAVLLEKMKKMLLLLIQDETEFRIVFQLCSVLQKELDYFFVLHHTHSRALEQIFMRQEHLMDTVSVTDI